MKKNFIYIFIVICITCYSCTSSFKSGKYNGQNGSENPNDFTFFEDSTFSYNYYGSIGKHSSGKYEIKDNKIILNSTIKDITIPIQYSIFSSDSLTKKNRITIQLRVPDVRTQKDYKCIPILNQDTLNVDYGTYTTYSFTPLDSVKLEIWVLPFVVARPEEPITTQTIYFDSVLEKDIIFNITIDESLFGYRVFDNVELVRKRNKITFIDTEESNVWRNIHVFKGKRDIKNTLYLRQD